LPAKIRLTVRDSSNARAISTVTTIHVQSPAKGDCKQQPSAQQPNGQQANGQQPNAQLANAQPQDKNCDDATAPVNAQGGPQQSNPSATSQGSRS
jgi:hypothetical protein